MADTRRSATGAMAARPAAARPAPAHAAPRCGGRATGGQWCQSAISQRDDSGGSVLRCRATSPCPGSMRRVALQSVSTTTAAAQELLADKLQAPATAPVTVRGRSPGPILRGGCVARAHRRAGWQQIIGRWWERTLMRHVLAPRPVASRPRGMAEPPLATGLVALSGRSQRTVPCLLSAVAGAVDLATVTAAADQRLDATARAKKQSRRHRVAMVGPADVRWTNATIAVILTPHACPARCGARRRA